MASITETIAALDRQAEQEMAKTVDGTPATSDQKISILLADSASKLLGNIGFKVWKGKIVRI